MFISSFQSKGTSRVELFHTPVVYHSTKIQSTVYVSLMKATQFFKAATAVTFTIIPPSGGRTADADTPEMHM